MKIASSTKRYYKRFSAHHAKHRISESLMRQKTLPEKRMILRFYCIKCVTGNGITFWVRGLTNMLCFARFGTICTILKTWKTKRQKRALLTKIDVNFKFRKSDYFFRKGNPCKVLLCISYDLGVNIASRHAKFPRSTKTRKNV